MRTIERHASTGNGENAVSKERAGFSAKGALREGLAKLAVIVGLSAAACGGAAQHTNGGTTIAAQAEEEAVSSGPLLGGGAAGMSQDGREGLGWHCEFRREEETDNPRPRVNFITDFDGTASDALEGVAGQDEAEQPVSGTSASILRECEEGVPDLGECLVERSTSLPHSRARGEIRAMMERLVAECREATAAAIRSCVVEKSAEGVTGDSSAQETRQSLGSEVEIVEATSRDETVLARVDIFDRGSNSTCRIPLPNAHLSFGYYDEDSGAEGIVPGCEDVVAGASERDGFLLGGYYGECDVSAVVEGKSSVIIRVTFVPQSGQSIEPSSGDYRILGFVTAYDDGATQPVTPQ